MATGSVDKYFKELNDILALLKKSEETEAAGGDFEKLGIPKPFELRDKVERGFWGAMSKIVDDLVQDELPDVLDIPPELEPALNFGLFPNPDCEWIKDKVFSLYSACQKQGLVYKVLFLTDALKIQYRETKRVDKLKELETEKTRTSDAIKNHPVDVEELRKETYGVITERLGPTGKAVVDMFKNWERLFLPYLAMERKAKEIGLNGREEILKFTKLKNDLSTARQLIGTTLSKAPDHKAHIEDYIGKIEHKHKELQELQKDVERTDDLIYKEKNEVKAISASQVKEELRGALNNVKGLVTLGARKCKITPSGAPLKPAKVVTLEQVFKNLEHLEEFDPRLYDNRKVKKLGRPAVIFVPGIGNGVYDYQNNRLLIPLMVPKDPLESVAAAVCMYRDDVDQQVNERSMINSFRKDIKENKKLRSILKVRQQFVKDYLGFMTKEAYGLPKLDKETKNWFEWQIAPSKSDPKTPREIRGLNSSGLKKMKTEVEQNGWEKDPKALHKLAIIHSYLDEKADQALEFITKALKLDNANPEILYNAGVISKKANRKDLSREFFGRYVKMAEQSWWSKKAQEMMR
ncbi:MAG: hypothetical protein NUW37_11080 [Planctomycetes bacterium]|nr:hypothetical protein [Planctomycetota bacterium]